MFRRRRASRSKSPEGDAVLFYHHGDSALWQGMSSATRMTGATIHFTLDFEADLGTAAATKSYKAGASPERLLEIVERYELPLTVFCEGEILEERFDLVEPLIEAGAEIELHGYDHTAAFLGEAHRLDNLRAGLEAYRRRFGQPPRAYRAPNGMIGRAELELLSIEGVSYDSSIFPTRFPGRFDFSHCPRRPFRFKGLPILELPFATLDRIRIPVALSYFQLFGPTLFVGLIALLGVPDEIVFDFHMHDLVRGGWHKRPGVPWAARLGYARAQSMADPARVLEAAARFFLRKGYRPEPLSHLYRTIDVGSVPEVELP